MDEKEIEEINLHYEMLEYVFEKQILEISCHNFVWENFKDLTSSDLKDVFWNEIIPNIENYNLLSNRMKEYFDPKNLFLLTDNNFPNALKNNEPKGRGKDYIFMKSPESYDDDDGIDDEDETINEQIEEQLVDAFENPRKYTNKFNFDTDSDTDENCLKIQPKKQNVLVEVDQETERLVSTFNLIVRTEDELKSNIKLSKTEIMKRLENPNIMSTSENVTKLPKALKLFMGEIDYFKTEMSEAIQVDSEIDSRFSKDQTSTLDVPSFQGSSDLSSTKVTNPSYSIQSQSNQASRSKSLVQNRAINLKMKSFVEKFKRSKRRRDSTSPQ